MTSPDAQARLTDHERIWLQPKCCGEHEFDGRQWCQDNVWEECDCANPSEPVEYIRADLARTPDAQPSSDWWQRFCTIMDKTDDEGFSPDIEQELMDLHAAIAAQVTKP